MSTEVNLEERLSKLEKKLDKVLNLNTRIAKALHLLPVTEKEERSIQVTQRMNLATASKINAELNEMSNISNNDEPTISITDENVYDGIIGNDI